MSILKLLAPIGALVSFINYKIDRLRLAKLINRGLKIGKNVYVMGNIQFDDSYPYLIEIGDNCRISSGVRILSHDATTFRDLGVTRIAPVRILEGTFIGERAIILPGVTVGPRALIAAGSVVNRDITEGRAVAGNPARPYSTYKEILEKHRKIAMSDMVFNKEDIERNLITQNDIIECIEKQAYCFIRGVPRKDPYYLNVDLREVIESPPCMPGD